MITEEIIQEAYIRKIITRDADRIYTTQADVVRQNIQGTRADNLSGFLSMKPFSAMGAPGKQTYHFRVLTYLRFLDIWSSGRSQSHMHIRRNLALYNRVIWGVLYHETLPDLKYGYTKDIRDSIKAELQSAVQQ